MIQHLFNAIRFVCFLNFGLYFLNLNIAIIAFIFFSFILSKWISDTVSKGKQKLTYINCKFFDVAGFGVMTEIFVKKLIVFQIL